jgi:phage-related protein
LYQKWYNGRMVEEPRLRVRFYREDSGNEPVREWLKGLPKSERKFVGADIKTVQFRWPVGLPWVRPLGEGLWEVRSRLKNRAARVIFAVERGEMILLHGLIKKTQSLPASDLSLARRRQARLKENR